MQCMNIGIKWWNSGWGLSTVAVFSALMQCFLLQYSITQTTYYRGITQHTLQCMGLINQPIHMLRIRIDSVHHLMQLLIAAGSVFAQSSESAAAGDWNMKTSCSRLVFCPSNNPQNLGIQNETAIGVTPDPFPLPKTQEKAVWARD